MSFQNIVCLFCNNDCFESEIRSDVSVYFCEFCNTEYISLNQDLFIDYFYVYISNLDIVFWVEEFCCSIKNYSKNTGSQTLLKKIPMDKLLLPLPELKEKINNLMAYT